MSSTPLPSSTTRVQSANNKINDELSNDSNKLISVSKNSSRPPSANKQVEVASAVDIQPEDIESRPSSVINIEPIFASTPVSSRPSSAIEAKNPEITNVRPPSANNKINDLTTNEPSSLTAGPRVPSANQKQNEANPNAAASLSASRPSTANKNQQESMTNCASTIIDSKEPNITQQIIERPSSGREKSIQGSVGLTTLVAAIRLNSMASTDSDQAVNTSEPTSST
ncbi:unnamed protein product [Adineta ricciae]|uniref:Uncharacterized protein n=1 Tax=Adineta ricciae TaxID=249248 RepID=A0A813RQN6_ADIRI|nr:unnamed protein product [Adineta ricciae]CAF1104503.1 unnamed protein product [Adineta ricciae]